MAMGRLLADASGMKFNRSSQTLSCQFPCIGRVGWCAGQIAPSSSGHIVSKSLHRLRTTFAATQTPNSQACGALAARTQTHSPRCIRCRARLQFYGATHSPRRRCTHHRYDMRHRARVLKKSGAQRSLGFGRRADVPRRLNCRPRPLGLVGGTLKTNSNPHSAAPGSDGNPGSRCAVIVGVSPGVVIA